MLHHLFVVSLLTYYFLAHLTLRILQDVLALYITLLKYKDILGRFKINSERRISTSESQGFFSGFHFSIMNSVDYGFYLSRYALRPLCEFFLLGLRDWLLSIR